MLKRFVGACAWACTACTSMQAATMGEVRKIHIYNAYVFQGEYGTAVEDPDCPTGGFMIKIDREMEGSEFLKVLRYGGGKLGPSVKHVIVDGVVQTAGKLGDRTEVTLVRVDSFREQIIDAQRYMELSEARLGCEKDPAHQRAWLESLQRKPRRR